MKYQTAYLMDCMDFMKLIPDKTFDLAIVDPPYGINNGGGQRGSTGKRPNGQITNAKVKNYPKYAGQDKTTPPQEYFDQLKRVSKNQIIFGANYMTTKINANSSCWIVWDKDNGANDFADCELAYTSFTTATRLFKFRWAGMRQGDEKHREYRIHPNQKPVALYKWILSTYAKPGDTILDTHLGSGSSRIAAHELGFNFTGIEKDPYYFAEQEKRYKNFCKQQNLFQLEDGQTFLYT